MSTYHLRELLRNAFKIREFLVHTKQLTRSPDHVTDSSQIIY